MIVSGNCFENNVDINGFDINVRTDKKDYGEATRKADSVWACQGVCQKTDDCEFFTYIIEQKECRLKTIDSFLKWSFARKRGHVSGKKFCNNKGYLSDDM